MTRLNVSKARDQFPEIVNRAAYAKERTVVSRRGKDLAAVVSMDDLRLLERLGRSRSSAQAVEDALAALDQAGKEGTVRLEEARKRLGLG